MKRTIEDASEIEYDKFGKGTPLVLLHAFPLCSAMWSGQTEYLEKEFKVIAPNARGIGGTSAFRGAPSVDAMAHDVALLLADMNLAQPVIVCGLSMGGYVALAFARLYPQRLSALVLCDTQAAPDSPAARHNREQNIAFAQKHTSSEILERMLPDLLGETTHTTRPNIVERVRQMAPHAHSSSFVQLLQALRDRPDATPHLANIKVPTLVLAGFEDTITPPTAARFLAENIPHAQLQLISQAGHLSNIENAPDFNRRLLSFLRAL